MKIPRVPHSWSVTPAQAVAIQRKLAARVVCRGRMTPYRLVSGADLAFSIDDADCIAGVVVWDVLRREIVEQRVVRRAVQFPYVPGLLTFREAPALLAALQQLHCEPDVFMFDGQGYAHPRRFGLACHMGVLLNRPSLGCAKTILVGKCEMPQRSRGSTSPLMHNGECVGMAVRTRDDVKPVYVSVGHRLSLDAAVQITLACCDGYRLPEPTRLADKLVARERTRTN
ncbi:MAG: deoxyribonuclease V [Planctomycetota bacterium]|jgi:deoxyribonuclease V